MEIEVKYTLEFEGTLEINEDEIVKYDGDTLEEKLNYYLRNKDLFDLNINGITTKYCNIVAY